MSKELDAYEAAEKHLAKIEKRAQELADMIRRAGNMLARHRPSQWLLATNPTVDDDDRDGSLMIEGNSDEGAVCSSSWPHFGALLVIQQEHQKAKEALKKAFNELGESEKRLVQAAKGRQVAPNARSQRYRY